MNTTILQQYNNTMQYSNITAIQQYRHTAILQQNNITTAKVTNTMRTLGRAWLALEGKEIIRLQYFYCNFWSSVFIHYKFCSVLMDCKIFRITTKSYPLCFVILRPSCIGQKFELHNVSKSRCDNILVYNILHWDI